MAPGFTRTNMIKDVINAGIDKYLPKGAIGDPEDVAAVACMICSRADGSFVNGETFPLSGGERNPKFKLPKLWFISFALNLKYSWIMTKYKRK